MPVFVLTGHFFPPHLHKETIKICHISGKVPNICINFLWRNPKWVWTILQKFKHNCIQLLKTSHSLSWKQTSKYIQMKLCSTISCTEIVSILLKTQGSLSLVTCYLTSKQEKQSFVITCDRSWNNVATSHHKKKIFTLFCILFKNKPNCYSKSWLSKF